MSAKQRKYKITGDPKDPYIIRLSHQNNRIFRKAKITNVRKGDKKPLVAELTLNQKSHGVLFTHRKNNRTEVCGFIDEKTGLFVTDKEGDLGDTAHIKFLQMSADTAMEAMIKEFQRQGREDEETREQQDYYSMEKATELLEDYLYSPLRFNADIGKQLSQFASRPLPNYNEYMVYEDDEAWNQDIYVTRKVPYKNPDRRVLTAKEQKIVDDFLDAFFDPYNKQAFSWYMGACLLNMPVYDERISRIAVITSNHGGSGKSSLMSAIMNGVFTDDYCSVKDEFDRFFLKSNRFSTDSLAVRRLTVYSEATWGITRDGVCEHDFDGLNISAIKSMVTDGLITKEPKFGDPATVQSSGFHVVLTNYLPNIPENDRALRRRILPIIMKPTHMLDKAEQLGLVGRFKLEDFVEEHAELFAAYFVKAFKENENMLVREEYSFNEESESLDDAQRELDEAHRSEHEALVKTRTEGFIAFARKAQEQTGIDMSKLIEDAQAAVGRNIPDDLKEHMRRDGDNFYIDGSKSFLMRYGRSATTIRKLLQEYYGPSVRKYHKRMFIIPLGQARRSAAETACTGI